MVNTIRRPAALRTIDRLYEAKGYIVGAILTKFDARRADYAYGYNYGYGYNLESKGVSAETKRRRRILVFNNADQVIEDKSSSS